mmetsp:Transcript_16754/g.27790  ORF Transcript_16754/g.27790 Transcript_16754/m.27790 type:complete len:116 (+) Transcript_16754:384-731(+)
MRFEWVIILLKRIEDSSGALSLSNVYDQVYLNSALIEAKHNMEIFFTDVDSQSRVTWNGKSTEGAKKSCPYYNRGEDCGADVLGPDGTYQLFQPRPFGYPFAVGGWLGRRPASFG